MGVPHQLLGLLLVFGPHVIGTELMNRLWRQAQMPHHGDSRRKDTVHRFEDLLAAFDLHRIGLGLLHDADGRLERHFRISLVRTERQIDHHQRTAHGACDRAGMINHHIERDRHRRFVTRHHVGRRVAHQNHIDPRRIHDAGHRIIVRSQHGDLLPALLHLPQTIRRDRPHCTLY